VGTLNDHDHYLSWVRVKVEHADVWFHTGSWFNVRSEQENSIRRHNQMTQQMCAQVRKHASGPDSVSVFGGDVKADDEEDHLTDMNKIFRTNDLLTIWDEFKVYPNTWNGSTVDVLGSYNKDKRVTGHRYKVWPMQHSDHRFVSAWYDIDKLGVPGSPGPDPTNEGFYVSGNRNWSDYFDGAIYHLPQAVDDSADPAHGGLISD
jgi:hypothetical protein